jgi:hypothetical protein
MRTGRQLAAAFAAHPVLAYVAIAHMPFGWRAFQDFTRGAAPLPELVERWAITTSITTAATASRLARYVRPAAVPPRRHRPIDDSTAAG